MKKILLTGITVILVLFLAACAFENGENGEVEGVVYRDWVMSDPDADGNRQLTLYFGDTEGSNPDVVPVTKSERALSKDLANMSHDFFEVIFVGGATPIIARTTWELGQNAGISGVYRTASGVNYSDVSATPAAAVGKAAIFVGRKSDRTLLAVGSLTEVDHAAVSTTNMVTTSTKSVTFHVMPLTSSIGIVASTGLATTDSSFLTDVKTPGTVLVANTTGTITNLGGVDYPLFYLPDNTASTYVDTTVKATYEIGGLDYIPSTGTTALSTAVLVKAQPTIIMREPRFIEGGVLYYANALIDTVTKAAFSGTFTVGSPLPAMPLAINIAQKKASNGITSLLFSIPVYMVDSTASALGVKAETWYITPGYGQALYNLDNGVNNGGCVLLGTNVKALDWIEIFVTGIGLRP